MAEIELLRATERALRRVNPPLLICGPLVTKTTDTGRTCMCAKAAYYVAASTRAAVRPAQFQRIVDSAEWVHIPSLVTTNEDFRPGDNTEAACRERHAHVLAWVRRRIREEESALAREVSR